MTVATLLVNYVEPVARGSGIPELKAYLNGNNQKNLLAKKTLFVKVVGICFSVSGGLICGKEGPMVHTGAVIALVFCHLSPHIVRFIRIPELLKFKEDRDHRDFASIGCAAGVSAAFGAPVGGLLFSLEEASSFWSVSLTWRTFLASLASTFILNIWLSLSSGDPLSINQPGLITFGDFVQSPYSLAQIPIFIIIAILGGLVGALFNHINYKISVWRRKNLRGKKLLQVIEAVLVAGFTATLLFVTPLMFSGDKCIREIQYNTQCQCSYQQSMQPTNYSYYCGQQSDVSNLDSCTSLYQNPNLEIYEGIQYNCKYDYYNSLASLSFQVEEKSIKNVFHNPQKFGLGSLAVYFFVLFLCAVITYGIAVPSGLFVPCILMGCALGRFTGELVNIILEPYNITVDSGAYAFIGSAAVLGGVSRMTISLAAILLETTNDIQYIIPIMITLIISKLVGDRFNISLYDIHIELKCFPFVEPECTIEHECLSACDVMSKRLLSFQAFEKVGTILQVLNSCNHSGFPVLNEKRHTIGLILRQQLVVMLNKKLYQIEFKKEDSVFNREQAEAICPMSCFNKTLQSKIPVVDHDISQRMQERYLDLQLFMNSSPFNVQENAPLSKVYRLFRGMGIRHLIVIDSDNVPLGIITRKELRTDYKQGLR